MTFDEIISLCVANRDNFEALTNAVMRNTIVPFVGAGMSYPYYPLWNTALDKLAEKVAPSQREIVNQEMIGLDEIDRCDVLERNIGEPALCRSLCEMFALERFTKAKSTQIDDTAIFLLPRLFPLAPLLTTNLDRMQEEVYRTLGVPFDRELRPTDGSILTVLAQQRAHGILYLHGCVTGKLTQYNDLVFSKAQYNRHYQPNSPLIHSLQAWMQDTQLLFLGCSLRNDRTLNVLNNLYDNHNRLEHFAILDLKPEDGDFLDRMIQLEQDYGIRAILYNHGEHEAVRVLLEELLRQVNEVSWEEYRSTLFQTPASVDENNHTHVITVKGVNTIPSTELPIVNSNNHESPNVLYEYEASEVCVSYNDGSIYRGQWCSGLRHGKGKMTWPNKDSFEGEWEKGIRSGNMLMAVVMKARG